MSHDHFPGGQSAALCPPKMSHHLHHPHHLEKTVCGTGCVCGCVGGCVCGCVGVCVCGCVGVWKGTDFMGARGTY